MADCIVAQENDIAMALATTLPWRKSTVGYAGRSDGLADLAKGGLQHQYAYAEDGHVAGTVELELEEGEFTVALGFGSNAEEAAEVAFASLRDDWHELEREYCRGWEEYCRSLDDLNGRPRLFTTAAPWCCGPWRTSSTLGLWWHRCPYPGERPGTTGTAAAITWFGSGICIILPWPLSPWEIQLQQTEL